jgi:hypothetical protein
MHVWSASKYLHNFMKPVDSAVLKSKLRSELSGVLNSAKCDMSSSHLPPDQHQTRSPLGSTRSMYGSLERPGADGVAREGDGRRCRCRMGWRSPGEQNSAILTIAAHPNSQSLRLQQWGLMTPQKPRSNLHPIPSPKTEP